MKLTTDEWNSFLEESKKETRQQIEELVQDGREDEARFLRASFNIYDVFGALFEASVKKANGDTAVLRKEFLRLAETVPSNWKKSLEVAKQHDDTPKILMEEAKLSTAAKIVTKFEELFSE